MKIIETLKAEEQKGFAPAWWGIAAIYSALGEKDKALDWLEKAYKEREPRFTYTNIEPAFDPLRSDSHFQDLMRRSRMPP